MSPFTLTGSANATRGSWDTRGAGSGTEPSPRSTAAPRTRGSRACSLGGGQLPPWGVDLTCCWPPSLPVGGPPPGGLPGPGAEDGAGNALVFLKVHGRTRAAGVWGMGSVQAPKSGRGKRVRVPAASRVCHPYVHSRLSGRPDLSLGKITLMGFFFFPSSRNKDLRRNRKQWHGISQACAVGYSHLCEPVSFRKHAHFLKKNVSLFLKNGFLVHCPRNLLVLGRCVCALNLRPSGPGWGHPAGGCSTRKEDDPCGAGVQKWTAGVTAAGPSGKTTVPGEAGPGCRASGKGASEGGMSRC